MNVFVFADDISHRTKLTNNYGTDVNNEITADVAWLNYNNLKINFAKTSCNRFSVCSKKCQPRLMPTTIRHNGTPVEEIHQVY